MEVRNKVSSNLKLRHFKFQAFWEYVKNLDTDPTSLSLAPTGTEVKQEIPLQEAARRGLADSAPLQ